MYNWRKVSNDPTSAKMQTVYTRFLKDIRIEDRIWDYLFTDTVKGKRVLDIGAVGHTIDYIQSEGWRHGKIFRNCKYALGIDIQEDLVRDLNQKGYNFRCADATSDIFLGEYFDIVFIGDVIEHVNNPVALVEFTLRHLTKGGSVYISTPNPLFIGNLLKFIRKGVIIDNAEHTCWITPTNMNEICYRASAKFKHYYVTTVEAKRFVNRILKRLLKLFFPIEFLTSTYIYEITH